MCDDVCAELDRAAEHGGGEGIVHDKWNAVPVRYGSEPFNVKHPDAGVGERLCKEEFGVRGPSLLSEQQKYSLAMRLKKDYYASNGEIARGTGLQSRAVDDLFPLSASFSSSK